MIFLDTSVIIAASTPSDPRNEVSITRLASAEAAGASLAAHSLAELFAVLTGRPLPTKVPPVLAEQIVRHTSKRFHTVTLTTGETLNAVQGLAMLGHSGGMIYDALLIACARKVAATRIFTWNQRHFRLIAPDLARIIREP